MDSLFTVLNTWMGIGAIYFAWFMYVVRPKLRKELSFMGFVDSMFMFMWFWPLVFIKRVASSREDKDD